eukprot:1188147-Prorocentrum_minimum.AAC.2
MRKSLVRLAMDTDSSALLRRIWGRAWCGARQGHMSPAKNWWENWLNKVLMGNSIVAEGLGVPHVAVRNSHCRSDSAMQSGHSKVTL